MPSIRLTDRKEIERLVKAGRLPKTALQTPQKTQTNKKLSTLKSGPLYSPYPPQKPVELLYHRICQEFGRVEEGGEAVWELEVPFTGRRWRIDIALPAYCCAIESDGYQYHGRDLAGFKRDRQKQLDLVRHGWSLIRISTEQIRHDLEQVISSINETIAYADYNRELDFKRTSFDRCRLLSNPARPRKR